MGSIRERNLARLANAAADLIANHPEAAAFIARKLSELLNCEAEASEECAAERDREARRRGFVG